MRVVLCVMLVALCSRARADGFALGSPRSIGRAGTETVGDDGAGALLANPAAIARRDTTRVQLGVAFVDDSVDWLPDTTAPRARNQAGSSVVPAVAIEAADGDWVLGLGAMTSGVAERALAAPGSVKLDSFGNRFQYRYAGLAGALRRDTVTGVVAHRFGDEIAIGVAAGASRVAVTEVRRIWAGFSGRLPPADPKSDIELAMSGNDYFVPSATAGVLLAPADTRVELGASAEWSAAAHVDGDVAATTAIGTTVFALASDATSAHLLVREPITLRTGARWAGEHLIAEVGGELYLVPHAAEDPAWALAGITVVDQTGVTAALPHVRSRLSSRTHGAARGALDINLVAGYLWATIGYAYATDSTAASRMSPTFAQLGGHTAALGLETTVGGFTISLGWSHTWTIARAIPNTLWRLDNPFSAGDGPVPLGRYDASMDLVGISIDAELGAAPP